MLGWSLDRLKEATARTGDPVGRVTIVKFENGDTVRPDRARAIRHALELAGIVFIGNGEISGEGGEGVRLERQG
jgi:hypothetical protein